jgi:glycosyltransferase EpsH
MVGLIGKELSDPSQADSLVTAWGKIYKTEIIKNHKIQFTDTKLIGTEDALFNIQYLEYAEKVKILNLPLYNYLKITEDSLTKLYKPYLFQQWKTLYQKISEIITNKEDEFKVALGIELP